MPLQSFFILFTQMRSQRNQIIVYYLKYGEVGSSVLFCAAYFSDFDKQQVGILYPEEGGWGWKTKKNVLWKCIRNQTKNLDNSEAIKSYILISRNQIHNLLNEFCLFLLVADQFCLEDLKSTAFISLCTNLNVNNVVDIYVEASSKLPVIGKI